MSELERLTQIYETAKNQGDELKSFVIPEYAALELAQELVDIYGLQSHRKWTPKLVFESMVTNRSTLFKIPLIIVK